MFDFIPASALSQHSDPPRTLGLRLVSSAGARLVLACSRLGGEEGTALACAFRDMVVDIDVHPLHWPIDEIIELLRKPAERPDAQVQQLIRRLERLRHEIGRPGSDPDA